MKDKRRNFGCLIFLVVALLGSLAQRGNVANATSARKNVAPSAEILSKELAKYPSLAGLQTRVLRDYSSAYQRSSPKGRAYLKLTQTQWRSVSLTRCSNEGCIRRLYWARIAELETFLLPKSPLYASENEKARAIERALNGSIFAPAFPTKPASRQIKECQEVFKALATMRNVKFLNPFAQAQSYFDPNFNKALDKIDKCPRPMNYSKACQADASGSINLDDPGCTVGYGLPPFKLFLVPDSAHPKKPRYIFYSDSSYGPLNQPKLTPQVGGGRVGFRQIDRSSCALSSTHPARMSFAYNFPSDTPLPNLDSIISFRGHYYYVLLNNISDAKIGYFLSLTVRRVSMRNSCNWLRVRLK